MILRRSLIFALAGGLLATPVSAQEFELDINALIDETQWVSPAADEMTMIWWMPTEFWRLSFGDDPSITEEDLTELLGLVTPYHIVLAADGTMGVFGGVTYETEQTVRSNIVLVDAEGRRHGPVDANTLDPDLQGLLNIMKPMLAGMLGPMGENMHFFVFPATTASGERFGDADSEGTLTVELDDAAASWRLPLSSVLPPKICPVDGERMSGAWRFCPWHGVELVSLPG